MTSAKKATTKYKHPPAVYVLRDIDPQLWARVKARADEEQRTLKAAMTRLLQAYAAKPEVIRAILEGAL